MKIFVPGQPQAKARAKARIIQPRGKKPSVQMYTPANTVNYENHIAMLAKNVMRGRKPTLNAVSLDLVLYFEVPASWSPWKREAAHDKLLAATAKPDADNVLKAVKDALNKIVWHDDSQVTDLSVKKRYGKGPGVSITITEITDISPCQITKKSELRIGIQGDLL